MRAELKDELARIIKSTENYLLKTRFTKDLPLKQGPRHDHLRSNWDHYHYWANFLTLSRNDEGRFSHSNLQKIKQEILRFDAMPWLIQFFLRLFTNIEWKRAVICAAEFSLAQHRGDGRLLETETVTPNYVTPALNWNIEQQLAKVSVRSSFYPTAQAILRMLGQAEARVFFKKASTQVPREQTAEALALLRLEIPSYFSFDDLNDLERINYPFQMQSRILYPEPVPMRLPFGSHSVYRDMLSSPSIRERSQLIRAQRLRIAYEKALPSLIEDERLVARDWNLRHREPFKRFGDALEELYKLSDSLLALISWHDEETELKLNVYSAIKEIRKLRYQYESYLTHADQMTDLINRMKERLNWIANFIPEMIVSEAPSEGFKDYHQAELTRKAGSYSMLGSKLFSEEQIRERASLVRLVPYFTDPQKLEELFNLRDDQVAQIKALALIIPRLQVFANQMRSPEFRDWLRRGVRTVEAHAPNAATIVPAINPEQSTHTASVHHSVSESAKNLMKRYGAKIAGSVLDETIQLLIAEVNSFANTEKNIIAKRCINRITKPEYTFEDTASKVSLRQLLAISYLAIHDETEVTATPEDKMLRFVDGLIDIQRGYNTDKYEGDKPICLAGSFNKLIELLSGSHADCVVRFVTRETASLKFPIIVQTIAQEYFAELLAKAKSVEALQLVLELADKVKAYGGCFPIWNIIKEKVAREFFEEFGSLYSSSAHPDFTEVIDAGQYVPLKFNLQKEIQNSPAYHAYCSRMLKGHGLFSRTAGGLSHQEVHDRHFGLVPVSAVKTIS